MPARLLGILAWCTLARSVHAAVEEEPIAVKFGHEEGCRAHGAGLPCGQPDHWNVEIGTHKLASMAEIATGVKFEAGHRKSPAAEMRVVITGSELTPWVHITKVLETCNALGIYRLEWRTIVKGGQEQSSKAWLPHDRKPAPEEKFKLEDIVLHLKWDAACGVARRRVGNGKELADDESVLFVIRGLVGDYKKLGRTEYPIHLEASARVPWGVVLHQMEIFRKEKLEEFVFILPAPEDGK